MVRILSVIGFILTISAGVQAQRAICQCLFSDSSHCCVRQVSPLSLLTLNTNRADLSLFFFRVPQVEAKIAPKFAETPIAIKTRKNATPMASSALSAIGTPSSASLAVCHLVNKPTTLLYCTQWFNC